MIGKNVIVLTGPYQGKKGQIVDKTTWSDQPIFRVNFPEEDYVWLLSGDFRTASDITFSKSFLEFLMSHDCKVSSMLLSDRPWVQNRVLEIGNHFAIRERDGMISYCPKGREQEVSPAGDWVRKGREEIKPGKFIRKILHEKVFQRIITDSVLEGFVNRFKAFELKDKIFFSVVSSADDINEAYESSSVSENLNTCMKDAKVGEFYEKMGARLVKAVQNGYIVGRAILWDTIYNREDVTIMDRIYGKDDIVQAMSKFARENNWWHKTRQSYEYKTQFTLPSGEQVNREVKIHREIPEVDFYPYLDTFTSHDGTYFYNDGSGDVRFVNTEGTYWSRYVTLHNGERIGRDHAFYHNRQWYSNAEGVYCEGSEATVPRSLATEIHGRVRSFYVLTECLPQ